MDSDSAHSSSNKRHLVFVVSTLITVVAFAIVGFIAWQRHQGGMSGAQTDTEAWCELRQEWALRAESVTADLMLAFAQAGHPAKDDSEVQRLQTSRQKLCAEHGARLRTMIEGNADLWNAVQPIELALIKSSKSRSNLSVEIHNATTQLALDQPLVIRRDQQILVHDLRQKIRAQKKALEAELEPHLTTLQCGAIYPGPMSPDGFSEDPYVTWDELELQRRLALKRANDRLRDLRSRERYAVQVSQILFGNYGAALKRCYHVARQIKPDLSTEMGLRIRLKKSGHVQTLGSEWMEISDDSLLDCLLDTAGSWRFPAPPRDGDAIIVPLNFLNL